MPAPRAAWARVKLAGSGPDWLACAGLPPASARTVPSAAHKKDISRCIFFPPAEPPTVVWGGLSSYSDRPISSLDRTCVASFAMPQPHVLRPRLPLETRDYPNIL